MVNNRLPESQDLGSSKDRGTVQYFRLPLECAYKAGVALTSAAVMSWALTFSALRRNCFTSSRVSGKGNHVKQATSFILRSTYCCIRYLAIIKRDRLCCMCTYGIYLRLGRTSSQDLPNKNHGRARKRNTPPQPRALLPVQPLALLCLLLALGQTSEKCGWTRDDSAKNRTNSRGPSPSLSLSRIILSLFRAATHSARLPQLCA